MVIVVDQLARVGQRETAQVLAASKSVGHRFLAVRGDIGNMTAQLINLFPTLTCDVTVIMPEPLAPSPPAVSAWHSSIAMEQYEQNLSNLIQCAGALSSSRAPAAATQDAPPTTLGELRAIATPTHMRAHTHIQSHTHTHTYTHTHTHAHTHAHTHTHVHTHTHTHTHTNTHTHTHTHTHTTQQTVLTARRAGAQRMERRRITLACACWY